MSYWEITAFETDRVILAMPPRIGADGPPAVIGRVCKALNVSTLYCGVCITIEYETPFSGLRKYVGATWELPARLTVRVLVTSRSVNPTYCARVRSTSTLKLG